MERRTYATILLLVLGIIEVYSFPSKSHPTDPELSRATVDEEQPRSSLQTIPFGHDDHGRIKRDDRDCTKPTKIDRGAELAQLRRASIERDLRQAIIATMVRERRATPADLTAIVDSYMREFGMNRPQATVQFANDHPTLANAFVPRPRL